MPDQPARIEIPDDLSTLTRAQLIELEGRLIERSNAINTSADAEDVAELGRIAETLPNVGARVDSIDAEIRAADEARATVTSYQPRSSTPPAAPTNPDEGDQGDQGQGDGEGQGDQGGTTDPAVEPGGTVDGTVVETSEAVAASRVNGRRTSAAEVATRAPQGRTPARGGGGNGGQWFATLTAGAEIPNVTASSRFESADQFRQALLSRTQALTRSGDKSASAMIAQAHLPHLEVINNNDSASAVTFKMIQAIEQWQAERNRVAVTADTGWCAPTETIYDLCDPYVADGMVNLPEIGITRGGIKYFPMPELACFTNYSWEFGPDELECMYKPCLEIPCPTAVEIEPGVIGACLTASILQARAFPELIDRYVRGLMTAHLMLISKRTLQQMEAGSLPVVYDDDLTEGRGFTSTLLNSMEFQSEDLREDYLLAEGETLAVEIPRWVRGAIRADLADRTGVDLLDLDNAYIDRLFTQRGFRPNWIKGWQNEAVGAPGAQRAYPTSVRYLIYREGAWVRGLELIIEMESMYDSVLLRQNKFTRLFTEQAIMLANMCTKSRVVTVPVCPNGVTSAPQATVCFAEAPIVGTVTCPVNVACPPVPCCGDTTNPAMDSIEVTPAAPNLAVGANQQLTVTGTESEGGTLNVTSLATYQSSDTAVATVNAQGVVHAVATGNATITASYVSGGDTLTDTSAVTVA